MHVSLPQSQCHSDSMSVLCGGTVTVYHDHVWCVTVCIVVSRCVRMRICVSLMYANRNWRGILMLDFPVSVQFHVRVGHNFISLFEQTYYLLVHVCSVCV